MPDTLAIRMMLEPDLLAYKALRDSMLAAHPDAFTSDAETERQRDLSSYRSRLAGGDTLFTLLALDGAQLVGALTCDREPRQKVRHTAHLIGMMVAGPHQGRGIGATLLATTLGLLRRDDSLSLVTLSVTASNAGAVRLYERHGFTRYGRLPGAIRLPGGTELDKDLMLLRL